jgi:hypothetical protein
VLEAVFILLEFPSPSRRIFIGSHSLPTSLVRRISPSGSHFHVFGSKCFILKKGKKLDKFEARSVDGIFFGYASHLEHTMFSILKLTMSCRLAR